jgi:hypothetical protein
VKPEIEIRPATRLDLKPFIISRHYAGRFPSVSFAYGLFMGEICEGVVSFGTPSSSPLRTGICGPEYAQHVLELNRLVLRSNVKNHCSQLVSGAIKRMSGDWIIISFADTSQGHVGTVYQASNFIYCGLSEKRTDWKIRGMEHLHGQTVADEFRGKENRAQLMREKYGDDFYLAPRPLKHRYVKIIGSRKFRKDALSALRYPQAPYPKRENA